MTDEDMRRAIQALAVRLRDCGHSGDAIQVLTAHDEARAGNITWEAAARVFLAAIVKFL